MTKERFSYWFYTISYILFIYSSLFYGKEVAKHIYKSLGYFHYSILIAVISLVGLLIILNLLKKNYTFFEFLVLCFFILIVGFTYFFTKFPTDRLHLLEYMILGLLIYKSLTYENISSDRFRIFLAILLLLAVSIEDEILQSYIPNRDAELEDILRDFIGGLSGIVISFINENKGLNSKSLKHSF